MTADTLKQFRPCVFAMPRLPSLSLVGDLAIDYGLRYELVLVVEDLDLTGATVVAQIKTAAGQVATQFSTAIAVQSALSAELTLLLEAATQRQAPLFQPGVYDWDVLLLPVERPPQYLFGGKIVVHQRVSHVA